MEIASNFRNWGEIGDHIMKRALEVKAQMDGETN
jgi:hypothetical protein